MTQDRRGDETRRSSWQERYDRSIEEERKRLAEVEDDTIPTTGTELDLLILPVVGFWRWLRRGRDETD